MHQRSSRGNKSGWSKEEERVEERTLWYAVFLKICQTDVRDSGHSKCTWPGTINVHLRCGTCGGLLWSGAGPGPGGGGGNGGIGGVDKPVARGTVVAGFRMLQRTCWPGPAAAETPAATPDQSNSRHVFSRSYILVREFVRKRSSLRE